MKKNLNTDKNPPNLAPLVNEFSYFIFSFSELTEERIKDWFSLPPPYWHTQPSYKIFENYAKTLIVVHDHSERAVGIIQQFVYCYNSEDEKQSRFLSVGKVRSIFRSSGIISTSLTKKRLSDSLSLLAKKQSAHKKKRLI